MADRIQQRRDTAERWGQFNPVLLEGEVGYVTDNPNQYKIGDGVHAWNELPLRGFDGTLVHELGDSQTAAMSQQGVTEAVNKVNSNTGIDSYPIFSESKAYSTDDVVNYNGKLYRFTAKHAAGAWSGTDVEEMDVVKVHIVHEVGDNEGVVMSQKSASSNFNQVVYTKDYLANQVIRKLFIDLSGYTGEMSLDGLYISILVRNVNNLWGFQFKNSNDETVLSIWLNNEVDIIERTNTGVFVYAELNWGNFTFGRDLEGGKQYSKKSA